jgi:hypothetical protein
MTGDFKRVAIMWSGIPKRGGSGALQKKVTSEIVFKGCKRHASKEEPQYIIGSDKTDHHAIHKGPALKKIKKNRS